MAFEEFELSKSILGRSGGALLLTGFQCLSDGRGQSESLACGSGKAEFDRGGGAGENEFAEAARLA